MTTLPAPENKPLDVVDGIIKDIIYGVGVNAAVAAAVAAMPWLGYPIIGWIFKWMVSNIAGMVFKAIEPFVDYQIIKFENDAQKKTYEDAIAALRAAQIKGDPDEKQKALDAAKAALDNLISYKH